MDHEVDYVVGVSDGWGRGAEAKGVADDFTDGGEDYEDGEGFQAGGVEAVAVDDEEDDEEGKGERREGEGGSVSDYVVNQVSRVQQEEEEDGFTRR